MEKQFSRTSMQFKGEGWYVTEYGSRKGGVEEKAEKELSLPEPAASDKAKPKKSPAKKAGSDKS
jgi:hypothetical protein